MADQVTLQIKGLDAIQNILGELMTAHFMRPRIEAGIETIKGAVAVYPPATFANQPRGWTSGGDNRWYERGWGTKWTRQDGPIGGYQTSETLGRSWTSRVDTDGMGGRVGTAASYAPWVQDRERQASWHAARGWRVVQDVAEAEGQAVVDKINADIDKIIKSGGLAGTK